jgi:hypothetical protein
MSIEFILNQIKFDIDLINDVLLKTMKTREKISWSSRVLCNNVVHKWK